MTAPLAITGVARPEPLSELSALLGIELLDVDRWHDSPNRPATWLLLFAAEPDRYFPYRSADFRNVARLNQARRIWRRDPDLRPVTKAECRRVLRLMHEHIESKTDTNSEGMDQ